MLNKFFFNREQNKRYFLPHIRSPSQERNLIKFPNIHFPNKHITFSNKIIKLYDSININFIISTMFMRLGLALNTLWFSWSMPEFHINLVYIAQPTQKGKQIKSISLLNPEIEDSFFPWRREKDFILNAIIFHNISYLRAC